MRILWTLLLLAVTVRLSAAPKSDKVVVPTNAPPSIKLNDQYDAPQKLSFPSTNVTVLAIADKAGSEQIAGWITPIQQRFQGRIAIRGIADVSAVPRLLRGMVRKKFRKIQSYPVMMDWTGDVVNAFTYVPGQANILVLDERGRILARVTGLANPKALDDLNATIDRIVARP